MPTYRVLNLGCKVNRVEADDFERAFTAAGFVPAASAMPADAVVVNTCTVTGEAEKKTRKAIRQALAANPDAPVFVTGCAAAINPAELAAIDSRVKIIPKHQVEQEIASLNFTESEGNRAALAAGTAQLTNLPSEGYGHEASGERSRTGLKIQDGCDNACTYCIVCKARGASISVPADRVINRAIEIARCGHREIILSGINLGAYCDQNLDLAGLLRKLLDATESICACDDTDPHPVRFRISSIEPLNITTDLINLLASSNGRVCRHLHIPLQSGSSRVLAEMARNYSAEEYLSLIREIRAQVPQIAISTDIIVGFPGETDSDFAQTMDMARACGFSKIHVFPYSRREGTLAAARKDQIDPQIKKARAKALTALGHDLRDADFVARAGSSELFCIQENGRMTSESYYELNTPTALVSKPETIGKLIELKL